MEIKKLSPMEELRRNFLYIRDNRSELMREYAGKNIAVLGCKVVDHDDNIYVLITRLKKKYNKADVDLIALECMVDSYNLFGVAC